MKLVATRNKGAKDILPADIHKWRTVEQVAADIAECYGFKEIRIPTFEKTELFVRSVGETTDVVQKEMFTVTGTESSFTLRPEGTAGVIRALLQNGLMNEAAPQKLFYFVNCFRHENVQKGRLWEFHQFGAEMAGSHSPAADAEVICFAGDILKGLGLQNISLHINSIGCPKCREEYYKVLREFLSPNREKLCGTCQSRFEKNPMRILDCKSDICKGIAEGAPLITDYLCDECREHFKRLCGILDEMGVEYVIDPKIVRGLDYYTKTVFEFISDDIGAQGTICGGGRYDGLIEEIGGAPTPALGFAMGLERVIMAMESQGVEFMPEPGCDIYIASMGENAQGQAMKLIRELREAGHRAQGDVMGRELRGQLKYADKIGAAYSAVIGDSELESGKVTLKNMKSGEKTELPLLPLADFVDKFTDISMADMFDED
ncbi:MAG: histidine--tRNA ligase [Oscillospiraceae bacterium]|nr:histidine--tRNA ligase [Oscillospiraceae bacterium]